MRTVPQDAPGYSPDRAAGLVGGVWVGLAFWYAFAAAPYSPAFMAHALSMSFRKYSSDPRRSHTVPGQFSEWLNGETLVNQGMMLSPWFPPRYVWAAIEGVAGLNAKGDTLEIVPHLAPDWKWLAVQNLPYRGEQITFFAVRMPEVVMYSNTYLQRAERARVYEEDITSFVHTAGPTVSAVGLRQGDDMVILAGSNDDRTVSTSLRIEREMSGAYDVRVFDSLLGKWRELGAYEAGRLQDGITMQIERRGFCLIIARQKT